MNVLDPGVWAGATPGYVGGPGSTECLGYWFELDAPGTLVGFSQYSDGSHPNFILYQLWDTTPHLLATAIRSAPETERDPGVGWRRTWLHPYCDLAASTPYLVSAALTQFGADFGRLLSAPVVSGHITVYQDGTSPNPDNGIYDQPTDTGGRFSFIDPPGDGVDGHLYGIDVLIEFAS